MIKQQGSNRVYSRVTDADGKTVIRVDGTNRDENRAFIYMSRHFAALGLPVPRVLWVSEDEMSYTQEDLGDTLLFDNITPVLLERATRALAHVQIDGAKDFDWSVCFPVPSMDERAIRWDLNYFKYCFLKGTKIEFSEPKLEDDFDRLTATILAQPADSFLYRDCQSRNIMIKDGQPYFIDFQGGRRGPTQYDVASLLWQAKANIAPDLREKMIDAYLDELRNLQPDLHESEWRAALPHFVLFRTLQVLGAYGYRGYFERKQHFLDSIPNALQNLNKVLAGLNNEYPYLYAISNDLLRGLPTDETGNGGGYIFDCRGTNNPGRYEQYKTLTGLDKPVIDFLEQDGEILTFLESVYKLVDHHVARFIERGFTNLQVAFGCTGGQHRSVYCAEHLAKHLKEKYDVTIRLIHRERGIEKRI